MKNFVLIFRQTSPLTETDAARRQAEVAVWARMQNAAGHQLEPRILAPDVLRSGPSHQDPHASPVTALLFLQADDHAQAARLAESHPGVCYGASVEVRPWAAPALAAAARQP